MHHCLRPRLCRCLKRLKSLFKRKKKGSPKPGPPCACHGKAPAPSGSPSPRGKPSIPPANGSPGTTNSEFSDHDAPVAKDPKVAPPAASDPDGGEKQAVQDLTLWERAYSALDASKHELVIEYEDLLAQVLVQPTSTMLIQDHPETGSTLNDTSIADNKIKETFRRDAAARRDMLKQISDLGLRYADIKKVRTTLLGHEILLQDTLANVAEAVEWVDTYIRDAISDLPHASIVMAGVSLVIPLLKNPTAQEAAHQDGFKYITSQLRYYDAMGTLILSEAIEPEARQHLERLLVNLYQLIIDFEVQSIMWLYRSRTKNFFRGEVKYDDWRQKAESVKKADADFFSKLGVALSPSRLQKLHETALEGAASCEASDKLVTIVRNNLQFAQKLERCMFDAESRSCMESLRATNPDLAKERIEAEKGLLLRDAYRSILEHTDFQHWLGDDQRHLLWICGDAGKGKTMLLCGIIDELVDLTLHEANVSFFFCQATHGHLNNATAVFRGLIYMLVKQQPSLISYLRATYDHGKACFEGMDAWVVLSRILRKMLEDPDLKKTHLIIDALDECTTERDLLLDFIRQTAVLPKVKWIVSSRNWTSIEKVLGPAAQNFGLSLELNKESVSTAVEVYIQRKVDWLARRNEYDTETREAVQNYLSANANSTFLWVALVCHLLKDVPAWEAEVEVATYPPELDPLYRQMMDQVDKSRYAKICKSILARAALACRPLTLDEVTSLVDIPPKISSNGKAMKEVITQCCSFLTLQDRTITFVHQSARDYLVEKAADVIFPSGTQDMHYSILLKSLQIMSETLRRDIYGLKAPGSLIDDIHVPAPDPLSKVKYSCVYWVDHLQGSGDTLEVNEIIDDGGKIDCFLSENYLNWLEALSLLRETSNGLLAMGKLEGILREHTCELALFIRDACRFAQSNKWVIEKYPLQTYASALIFTPTRSLTRMRFQSDEPNWMVTKPLVQNDWGACLLTLEDRGVGDLQATNVSIPVAVSSDGRLASGSTSATVKIWDPATGRCISTLEGHTSLISSVAWSDDGRLASGSHDQTVRIWDPATGTNTVTLEGHANDVTSVAWSANGQLASGSGDKTVKIWDAATGQCTATLEGHTGMITSVAWWGNERLWLASGSEDTTVKIWDPATGQCTATLEGHEDVATSVTWAGNGQQLASGSADKTIKIWYPATGHCRATLEGHAESVGSVAWSNYGLASGSHDQTIKIWYPATGNCEATVKGHTSFVNSVVWLGNGQLASGSGDTTVKIWDPALFTSHYSSPSQNDHEGVFAVAWSKDGQNLASLSEDEAKVWDPATGRCTATLQLRDPYDQSYELERSRDPRDFLVWSRDNRQIALLSGPDVKIWDLAAGYCTATLAFRGARRMAWSPNGGRLALGSQDEISIWDAATGERTAEVKISAHRLACVAWSSDGRLLASGSDDDPYPSPAWDDVDNDEISGSGSDCSASPRPAPGSTVEIWHVATGQRAAGFRHVGRFSVRSLAWSGDGQQLAAASPSGVQIWDRATGRCTRLFDIENHDMLPVSLTWSGDNRQLAAAWHSHVQIWDLAAGKCTASLDTVMPTLYKQSEFLRANVGIFNPISAATSANDSGALLRPLGCGLDDDEDWITFQNQNRLWLPSEYRPAGDRSYGFGRQATFDIFGPKIAIACISGCVVMMELSN